jgi:tetratricopeptide (TPR) repeat protein
MMWKPGQPIVVEPLTAEDVQPTDDVNLAREQANHFPDSAEAAFILAVALTRTSHVEEALAEVRTARKLATAQGGPAYFDKMIQSYVDVLKDSPDDDRIRYMLAWAYYMKAYLLAQDSKKQAAAVPSPQAALIPPANAAPPSPPSTANNTKTATLTPATPGTAGTPALPNTAVPSTFTSKGATKKVDANLANLLLTSLNPAVGSQVNTDAKKVQASQLPHIPGALEKAAPSAVPQIHQYYALALKNLDEILAKKPDDVWALVYRWHLYAEETGNIDEAINHWRQAEAKFPSNPGVHFFLGEGYLRKGNLKEAFRHAGQAVMLRSVGM